MPLALRLVVGSVAAAAGALAGAVAWAAITTATTFQIGYMAVGVGLLAGYGMRLGGGGRGRADGVIAATIALAGCVVGNWLIIIPAAAKEFHRPLADTFVGFIAHPALSLKVMQLAFDPMDVLFYGIAAYAGYRTARKPAAEASSVTASANGEHDDGRREQRDQDGSGAAEPVAKEEKHREDSVPPRARFRRF